VSQNDLRFHCDGLARRRNDADLYTRRNNQAVLEEACVYCSQDSIPMPLVQTGSDDIHPDIGNSDRPVPLACRDPDLQFLVGQSAGMHIFLGVVGRAGAQGTQEQLDRRHSRIGAVMVEGLVDKYMMVTSPNLEFLSTCVSDSDFHRVWLSSHSCDAPERPRGESPEAVGSTGVIPSGWVKCPTQQQAYPWGETGKDQLRAQRILVF